MSPYLVKRATNVNDFSEDVCVLSATGTAAVIGFRYSDQQSSGKETAPVAEVQETEKVLLKGVENATKVSVQNVSVSYVK